MKRVGDKLKQAREAKGWTPEAAAKATKIKVPQILAIENGDYSGFASASYARGFVRIYAQTLDIDPAPLLAELDGNLEDRANIRSAVAYMPEQVDTGNDVKAKEVGMLVMGVLAVLLIAGVGWFAFQAYRAELITMDVPQTQINVPTVADFEEEIVEETPAADPAADAPKAVPVTEEELAAESVEVVETAPAEETAPAADAVNHTLVLQAVRSSWARVESVDARGRTSLYEGIIEAGTEQNFEGTQFNLKIAIPAAVNIVWDGNNEGPYSNHSLPQVFSLPRR